MAAIPPGSAHNEPLKEAPLHAEPPMRHGRKTPAFPGSFPSPPFTDRGWMLLAAIIFILFLPTLLHPLSTDQGLFNLNGTMLLQGGVYYRDMVEMKPPLLSFLYAGANLLFQAGEYSIRFLDLLLQMGTCWIIISLVRRSGGGDRLATASALCYALIYVAQRYSQTAQAESYAGLFGLGMLWLLLFKRNNGGMFLIGLLGGMLWLLKFPLAILLLIPPVAELWPFRTPKRAVLRHVMLMGSGFAIIAGLFFFYLTANGAYDDFLLISEFTRGYAMTELKNPRQWLINLVTVLPMRLLLDFSPVVLVGLVASIPLLRAKGSGKHAGRLDQSERSDRPDGSGVLNTSNQSDRSYLLHALLRLCWMALLLLLATIIIEGKYPPYHFARIFPFGAIPAAAGVYRLGGWLRNRLALRPSGGIALAAAALLLGPLLFYGWRTLLPVGSRLLHPNSLEGLARYDASVTEPRQVAEYISRRRRPGDRLFAAASMGGQIYYHTGFLPATPIYHFGFINATYGPSQWGDSVRNYILLRKPRFIVAELGDSYPGTTGSRLTSEERLRRFAGVDSVLRGEYREGMRLGELVVYEWRE